MRILQIALLLTFAHLCSAAQASISGAVVEVIGNRILVVDSGQNVHFRILLADIETPTEEQQPMHDVVRGHVIKLAKGRMVNVRFRTSAENDYIGRVVIDGRDLSMQLVRDGAAWYTPASSHAPDPEFKIQEDAARAEKRGVWGADGLVNPSQLRALTEAADEPQSDPNIAVIAWSTLGPAVENVFGRETFTWEASDCDGEVIEVLDGDTVRIRNRLGHIVAVRLAGIDAPELSQTSGRDSKNVLVALVLGKQVKCESDRRDRYGRSIAKIRVEGRDVNLTMVQEGAAWHYKEYAAEQSAADRATYAAAESNARGRRSGLWIGDPTRPSDYRKHRFLAVFRDGFHIYDPSILPPDRRDAGGYSPSGGYYPGGSRHSPGGPVQVKGYFRSNGTYVQPHTRSRPRN